MGKVSAKYRELHPSGFSDSKRCCRLTEDLLRLRLNELSERMMQDAFEQYALGLLRLYVTPNILPPTGPNAGGDGKTDLETYSVSDDVSLYWAVENNGAVNENWAFAISTQEDWKRKLKKDIASASGHERVL